MASYLNLDQLEASAGTLTTENNVTLSLEGNNTFMLVPQGTSAQRSSNPPEGAIRWNTDLNQFEVYNGTVWRIFRRIYDFSDKVASSLIISLEASDPNSYPTSGGLKWFDNGFEPFKAIFQSEPTRNTTEGGFIEFDGTNYATIEIDSAGRLTPTASITQECWFKQTNVTDQAVLIALQYGISSNNAFALWVQNGTWHGGVNIDGTFQNFSVSTSTVPRVSNTWYHFVHTYRSINFTKKFRGSTTAASTTIVDVDDFSNLYVGMNLSGPNIDNSVTQTTITSLIPSESQIVISNAALDTGDSLEFDAVLPPTQLLYVNGEPIGRLDTTGNISYNANNTLITIGDDFNGPGANSGGGLYLLDGGIASVRLYNNALSLEQVKQNFNATKARYGY